MALVKKRKKKLIMLFFFFFIDFLLWSACIKGQAKWVWGVSMYYNKMLRKDTIATMLRAVPVENTWAG